MLEAAEHNPCILSPVVKTTFVSQTRVVPAGTVTSFNKCGVTEPPDLTISISMVTSALLELTLAKDIPIIVSVVLEPTASSKSALLVPNVPTTPSNTSANLLSFLA